MRPTNGRHLRKKTIFSRKFKMLLLGLFVLSSIFLINQLHLSSYFPIKTIRIYGINHVSQSELQSVLLPLVQKGFFGVDMEEIRDKLSQVTWVSDMLVKRVWPDQLEVALIEKQTLARWNGNDLLTEKGDLFLPPENTAPKGLAELYGPAGKHRMVLSFYEDINRLLTPLHVKIFRLELTPYYTWNIELTNHIKLQVGYQDGLSRVKRFVTVYDEIVGNRANEVNYIDLRYSSGLAVRWKDPDKIAMS